MSDDSNLARKKPAFKALRPAFNASDATIVPPAVCPSAVRLQIEKALRKMGCSRIGFASPETAMRDRKILKGGMIAIGDFESNPLIGKLYAKRLSFTDSDWPGRGGSAVVTLADPFGLGGDVTLIAGSCQDQIAASARRFQKLADGGLPQRGGWHSVRTSHKDLLQGICGSAEEFARTAPAGPDERIKLKAHMAVEQALRTYLTGKGAGLEIFREHFLDYLESGDETRGFPGNMVYSWYWKAVIIWELIQWHSAFSDDDQRRMTSGLFEIMQWMARSYAGFLDQPPGEIRHNHWTYLGISLHLGRDYFRRRHGWRPDAETDEKIGALFEGQCRSAKINDDAAGYAWQVPRHLLIWLRHQERNGYFQKGHLHTLAEQAIIITDNLGAVSTYGDSHGISASNEGPQHTVVALAHWHHRDPALRWFLDRIPSGKGDDRGLELKGWFDGRYSISDRRTAPPYRHLGIRALILDKPPLEWVRRRFPGTAGPGRRYFDKIAFRHSFDPDDEYLMLEGTSTFAHGHQDGNGIVQLTWRRRRWLLDCDYLRGMPEHTNGLSVIRNGATANTPPLSEIRRIKDSKEDGSTHTVLEKWNGGDWHRFILWRKKDFFAVADSFVARESGNYHIVRRWRCIGKTSLQDTLLACSQKGEDFFIRVGGGHDLSIHTDGPDARGRECDFAAYPYADPLVTVLEESWSGELGKGQEIRFYAVLSPERPGELHSGKQSFSFSLRGNRFEADFSQKGCNIRKSRVNRRPAQAPICEIRRKNSLESLKTARLAEGEVSALARYGRKVLAGFADGRVVCLDECLGTIWSRRLAGRITALGSGQSDGKSAVLAGTSEGIICRLSTDGAVEMKTRVAQPGPILALASLVRKTDIIACTPEGIAGLEAKGKQLWFKSLQHGSSGCMAAVAANANWPEFIVAGTNYHSSINFLDSDGRTVAQPWIRMDSTVQSMSALSTGDIDADGDPEIVWGTLGHTIFAFPLPGESERARSTLGRGRPLAEGRMAGAILALRILKDEKGIRIIAADASGYAAQFDGSMRRTKWIASGIPGCQAAAISEDGDICICGDNSEVAFVSGDFSSVRLGKIGPRTSTPIFIGNSLLLGTPTGLISFLRT